MLFRTQIYSLNYCGFNVSCLLDPWICPALSDPKSQMVPVNLSDPLDCGTDECLYCNRPNNLLSSLRKCCAFYLISAPKIRLSLNDFFQFSRLQCLLTWRRKYIRKVMDFKYLLKQLFMSPNNINK